VFFGRRSTDTPGGAQPGLRITRGRWPKTTFLFLFIGTPYFKKVGAVPQNLTGVLFALVAGGRGNWGDLDLHTCLWAFFPAYPVEFLALVVASRLWPLLFRVFLSGWFGRGATGIGGALCGRRG